METEAKGKAGWAGRVEHEGASAFLTSIELIL